MSPQTYTPAISALAGQFNLQTRLFKNVLEGISDKDATRRINGHMNHIAWLAGHIVSTRYMLANALGLNVQEAFPDLFANGKGIQEGLEYPPLSELKKDWEFISDKLIEKLNSLTEKDLEAKPPFPTPIGENTIANMIAFFAHHEAYTIGQLGMCRKFLGYNAMKYT
jgi:hypothetical protein